MKGTHVFEVYKNSVLGKTDTYKHFVANRNKTKRDKRRILGAKRVPHKTKAKIGHKRDNFYLSLI